MDALRVLRESGSKQSRECAAGAVFEAAEAAIAEGSSGGDEEAEAKAPTGKKGKKAKVGNMK